MDLLESFETGPTIAAEPYPLWSANIRKLAKDHKGYGSAARPTKDHHIHVWYNFAQWFQIFIYMSDFGKNGSNLHNHRKLTKLLISQKNLKYILL